MNHWLLLVLLCLFVWRVTRLVTTDTMPLVAWPRETIVLYLHPEYADDDAKERYIKKHGGLGPNRWGALGDSLAYLITCDWCASAWVSAVTMWILYTQTDWFPGVWVTVLYGVAAAGFTGWFAQKVE